jgi:hypothetical protein
MRSHRPYTTQQDAAAPPVSPDQLVGLGGDQMTSTSASINLERIAGSRHNVTGSPEVGFSMAIAHLGA